MNTEAYTQGSELFEVFKQYGWQPTLVENVGRRVWRITLREGVYALKKSRASREKLHLLHKILKEIRSQGHPHLLPWLPTRQGEPIVTGTSGTWYATPWKSCYGISEHGKQPAVTELAQALARLHRLSEPLVQNYPDLCTRVDEEAVNKWKQRQEKLANISDQIKSREFQSPFDKCFSGHKESIEQSLAFFLRGMERFMEKEGGKSPRYTLCHRRLHPSNVARDEERFYLIDFDHAQVDSPVRDLALLMRRYASFEGDPEKPLQILEAYEAEWPLQPKEKKLLALYLAYPERLLKTVERYYEEPKITSMEAHAVKRLEEEIHHLAQLQEAVKTLWPGKKARTEENRQPFPSVSGGRGKKKAEKKRKS
ncbi:phosphotransferase [Lihuaxuella thermophila]|uniref:Spore coat protein YsxE n=1 Tax=Lihuaxuella thermophila TaxID=1173111 RepID=A0A1H8D293_9BACL|nr:phosphotransferase [Lihuaxuella thermophila]SEN01262.1 spore coat protein YsxE [Lihuaxuella thermophila]